MAYADHPGRGKQYRVEPGSHPDADDAWRRGIEVTFDEVLLSAGWLRPSTAPRSRWREGHGRESFVTASVTKIVVFKFKRRKNYARKQGHRQGFTEVRIGAISVA